MQRTIIGWRKSGAPIYLIQGAEDGGATSTGGTSSAGGSAAGAGDAGQGGSGGQAPAGTSSAGAGDAGQGTGGTSSAGGATTPPGPVGLDATAVAQLKAMGWLPPGTTQQAPAARNHTFAGDGGANLPDLDYQSALREVANLRKENGRDRTQAQNQIHSLYAQAIGVDDATPDKVVARLAELANADTRAANAALRLAVYQRASMIGANADRLLDSQAFLSGLAGLDPTGSDALDAKIREAADRDPVLRSQTYQAKPPPAGQAVAPFGGTTAQPNGKPKSLASALDAHYSHS